MEWGANNAAKRPQSAADTKTRGQTPPRQYSVQTRATIPPPPDNDTPLRIQPTHARFAEQYAAPTASRAANDNAAPASDRYHAAGTVVTQPTSPAANDNPATTADRVRRGQRQGRRRSTKRRLQRRLVLGKFAARGRATRANIWILSWGMFFWFWFQVPVGVLYVAALGAAGGLRAVVNSLLNYDPKNDEYNIITDDFLNVIDFTIDELYQLITRLDSANWILELGDPLNLAVIMFVFLLAHGLLVLCTMGILYELALLRPLSGRGAGLKVSALLLAVAGYMLPVPFLNMLPWFLLWAGAVWLYPR